MKIKLLKTTKIMKNKDMPCLEITDVVFILFINVKMPTVVGIFTLMSRKKHTLSDPTSIILYLCIINNIPFNLTNSVELSMKKVV